MYKRNTFFFSWFSNEHTLMGIYPPPYLNVNDIFDYL